jgi:hypothetical protein
MTRLRRIEDVELRLYLAAAISVLVSFLIIGVSGPVSSSAGGPYYWFTAGAVAFWLAGRRAGIVSSARPGHRGFRGAGVGL